MTLSRFRFLSVVSLLFIGLLSFFASTNTFAASAKKFNPGNIITDYVMSNYTTMSVSDINNFLHSKNSCNDTDISKAYRYSSYSYHIENGHFVCMADESFNGKSAAQIIYDAAQTYRINPQVLIVLLQKEQGLVTDTWPNSIQYRSATGYGCPDTAACDTKYYGFENQVNNAAALFRSVLDGGWSNYLPGLRYISYHPNSACGGSMVDIQNRATSALYRYAPYQPNSSALAAGYGTGDSCSSYGNRNFYLYFTDWFGNPTVGSTASTSTYATAKTTTSQRTYYFSKYSLPRHFIPDGNYQILTLSGKAIDVSGASTSPGANIQIYQHGAKNNAQIFRFSRDAEGFYTITNVHGWKVLDVSGASVYSGANIQTWVSNNTCAQKWAINVIDGHYTFRSACSGNAIDVAGAAISTNGANVWSYVYNATSAQQFDLLSTSDAPIANGNYSLITHLGKNLTAGANRNVEIHDRKNNSPTQAFTFSRMRDGFYRISQTSTDLALTANANGTSGSNVRLAPSTDACTQKWGIAPAKNYNYLHSYYTIYSACSGTALDVFDAQISTSGTNVQVYDGNNSIAQVWTLAEPSYNLDEGTYTIMDNFSDKAFDFTNSNATLGAQLETRIGQNLPSQEFRFTRTNDGYYKIINVSTNLILSLPSTASITNLTPILQNNHEACSAKWYFSKFANHTVIHSACSGHVLTSNTGAKLATPIITSVNRRDMFQSWTLVKR